jgi:hypothetical protein
MANALEDVTVDFELKRGTWLHGKVVDQVTGKPMRCYVAYNVFEDNPHHQDPFALYVSPTVAMTGDDGTFRLLILPGRGLIGAGVEDDRYCFGEGADKVPGLDKASGHFLTYPSRVAPRDFHALLEVRPAEGVESVRCTIFLRPGRTRTGAVQGPDGKPLAGASVSGLGSSVRWESEPLKTAAFTVKGLEPNRARLVQFAHAAKRLAGFAVIYPEDKDPLTVRLVPAGTLTGRLVTPQGRPLAGLEIASLFADPPARRGGTKEGPLDGSFPPGVRSGKDGRFRIAGLAPGLKYNLGVTKEPGYRLQISGKGVQGLTIRPGETKDLGDVEVKPME